VLTMSADARDTFVIVWRELCDLACDKALVIVVAGSTFGLPLYLGYLAATQHLAASHMPAWGLEVVLLEVFIASTTALQGLAVEREQGTLLPLIASPVSDLALFLGRALPAVLLSAGQSAVALGLFLMMLAVREPAMLSGFKPATVLLVSASALSAAMMCAGLGISLGSRMRSSRAIGLTLTLSSLGVVSLESALGLWGMFDPVGRALASDLTMTQPALGLAALAAGAALYRRAKLVQSLWR